METDQGCATFTKVVDRHRHAEFSKPIELQTDQVSINPLIRVDQFQRDVMSRDVILLQRTANIVDDGTVLKLTTGDLQRDGHR